jgi:hypothetical protein
MWKLVGYKVDVMWPDELKQLVTEWMRMAKSRIDIFGTVIRSSRQPGIAEKIDRFCGFISRLGEFSPDPHYGCLLDQDSSVRHCE